MKTNTDKSVILIENPLTGSTFLGRGFGLTDGQYPKWCKPSDARELVGEDVWRAARKVVAVRLPASRFVSGVSLCLRSTTFELRDAGASEAFVSLVGKLKDIPESWLRGARVLSFLTEHGLDGNAPVWMHPQKEWLSAMFDTVVASHDIAEFITVELKTFVRTGSSANVGSNRASLENRLLPVFQKLYHEDDAMFSRLLVWSRKPGKVRLISGYCETCSSPKDPEAEPINLMTEAAEPTDTSSEVVLPAPDAAPVESGEEGDAAVVRPRRKRARQG